jgi:hypothetical protein
MNNFNICTTGNTFFFSVSHRTLKLFLNKISSSAPGGRSCILKIPVWKLYECPSLLAAKFVQSVSLLKYYGQLKSG